MLTEKFLSKKIGTPVVLEKPHDDLVYILHYQTNDTSAMKIIDKVLTDYFASYGYEQTGSGYSFFSNERDIRFQKVGKKKGKK